jgi:hypothetical protein
MQQSISGKGSAVDSSTLLAAHRKAVLRSAERSYAEFPKKMLVKSTEQLQDRVQCAQACGDISVYQGPEPVNPNLRDVLTFALYDAKLLDPRPDPPIITDSETWGTPDNTLLTHILTLGTDPNADGTIVPFKENAAYNYMSLHITGFYTAPMTGTYVFTVVSDDGITIKLGGTTILSAPNYSYAGSFTTAPIALTKGSKYPLEMLWSNGLGGLTLVITQTVVNGWATYTFNPHCSPA